MTLKKQSIRQNMSIKANGKLIKKDELIKMSESWTESQENMFRKCLKQGVFRFTINKITFQITLTNK
tara:strand:- start:129 stop:329 length:201 start_codon:yes stop_codon:yes gene_type:complete